MEIKNKRAEAVAAAVGARDRERVSLLMSGHIFFSAAVFALTLFSFSLSLSRTPTHFFQISLSLTPSLPPSSPPHMYACERNSPVFLLLLVLLLLLLLRVVHFPFPPTVVRCFCAYIIIITYTVWSRKRATARPRLFAFHRVDRSRVLCTTDSVPEHRNEKVLDFRPIVPSPLTSALRVWRSRSRCARNREQDRGDLGEWRGLTIFDLWGSRRWNKYR